MEIYKGKIIAFNGSWSSGLGHLVVEDENGKTNAIPCDNGPTVRALEACFGNVITAGHTANGKGYQDQEIFYSYDEFGLVLGGFTPVKEASEELLDAYEKTNEQQAV